MAEFKLDLNENNLILFINKFKTSDKHPDYKGSVKLNGEIHDICLYVKQGSKENFFGGFISKKREVSAIDMATPTPLATPLTTVDPKEPIVDYNKESETLMKQININEGDAEFDLPF